MIFARLNQGSTTRPGAGLPFYLAAAYAAQSRPDMRLLNYYTWISTQEEGIPFEVMGTGVEVTAFRLVGMAGGTSYVLSTGLLSTECVNGSDLFITHAGADWGTTKAAGFYYFEVVIDGVTTLYSDWFHVCNNRATNCQKIEWWDSKDWVAGAYYGAGYKNRMYVETDFARPRVEYTEETIDDGLGNLYPTYQRTEEVYSCDIIACDSQLQVLNSIAQHNIVQITSPLGGGAHSINTIRCSDTGERKDALAVVEFSFKVDFVENTTIDEPTLAFGAC